VLAVGLLLLSVVVAIGWQALAPTSSIELIGGVAASADPDTPAAVVDALFVVLTGAAGVLVGLALAALLRDRAAQLGAAAVVGGLVASALAWQLGGLLGPPALRVQQQSGAEQLVAPLVLSTPLTVMAWPAATAAALFLGLLVSLVLRPPASS